MPYQTTLTRTWCRRQGSSRSESQAADFLVTIQDVCCSGVVCVVLNTIICFVDCLVHAGTRIARFLQAPLLHSLQSWSRVEQVYDVCVIVVVVGSN